MLLEPSGLLGKFCSRYGPYSKDTPTLAPARKGEGEGKAASPERMGEGLNPLTIIQTARLISEANTGMAAINPLRSPRRRQQ